MGLIDGLASALGTAADTGAAGLMDQYKAQIEQDRLAALMQMQESMKLDAAAKQRAGFTDAFSNFNENRKAGLVATANQQLDARFNPASDVLDQQHAAGNLSDDDYAASIAAIQKDRNAAIATIQNKPMSSSDWQDFAGQTGYTDEAAKMGSIASKDEIAQMRTENFKDRTEMMSKLQEMKSETALQIAEGKLQAAREKAANGKIDTATGRMLITSYDADIRASTSMLNMVMGQIKELGAKTKMNADTYDQLSAQADIYRKEIKAAQANKIGFFKSMGYPAGDFTPEPGTPSGSSQDGGTDINTLFPKKK